VRETSSGSGWRSPGEAPDIEEANRRVLASIEEQVIAEVDAAAAEALRSRESSPPPPESAFEGVYAPRPSAE